MAYEDLASILASVLNKDQLQEEAQNPWSVASNKINALDLYSPKRSNSSNILASLVQGLAGGTTKGIGDYTNANDREARYNDLANVLANPKAKENEDSIFAPFMQIGELGNQELDAKNQRDIDKAVAIKSADNHNYISSARPLEPQEKAVWAERLKLTPEEMSTLNTAGDLDRTMRSKQMLGEKVRPPSPSEVTQINANDNFQGRINDLKDLANQLDDNSLVRATKGGKMLSWFGDTESPDYKFFSIMKAAQQEYARSKDSGALSTYDVKLWGPLFEGLPLLDSSKAIKERLNYIEKTMKRGKLNLLDNLEKGLVNISGYEADRKGLQEALDSQTNNTPTPPPNDKSQVIPPGMRLLRNKKTGETKLVPG